MTSFARRTAAAAVFAAMGALSLIMTSSGIRQGADAAAAAAIALAVMDAAAAVMVVVLDRPPVRRIAAVYGASRAVLSALLVNPLGMAYFSFAAWLAMPGRDAPDAAPAPDATAPHAFAHGRAGGALRMASGHIPERGDAAFDDEACAACGIRRADRVHDTALERRRRPRPIRA